MIASVLLVSWPTLLRYRSLASALKSQSQALGSGSRHPKVRVWSGTSLIIRKEFTEPICSRFRNFNHIIIKMGIDAGFDMARACPRGLRINETRRILSISFKTTTRKIPRSRSNLTGPNSMRASTPCCLSRAINPCGSVRKSLVQLLEDWRREVYRYGS